MKTFWEFLAIVEGGLWMRSGPQANPSNPGTKRRNAKSLYNHRYGGGAAGGMGGMGSVNVPVQPLQPQQPQMKG